jgi:hypothetical protein
LRPLTGPPTSRLWHPSDFLRIVIHPHQESQCTHVRCYAQRLHGVQIGLINIIKTGGQFPVFPIVNWSF